MFYYTVLLLFTVGYSTCHWCHVMERESFEDVEIGKVLSENFVCIKVDREERPDVDKVYMTFVQVWTCKIHCCNLQSVMLIEIQLMLSAQATSGGGGWPMSVWLTPDLRPFIGGTYFPPRDSGRRPGLKTVLLRVIEQVRTETDISLFEISFVYVFILHSCNAFLILSYLVQKPQEGAKGSVY